MRANSPARRTATKFHLRAILTNFSQFQPIFINLFQFYPIFRNFIQFFSSIFAKYQDKPIEIAANYCKLQKLPKLPEIAWNCIKLPGKNWRKLRKLRKFRKLWKLRKLLKLPEIARNCPKLPEIAWNYRNCKPAKLPQIA